MTSHSKTEEYRKGDNKMNQKDVSDISKFYMKEYHQTKHKKLIENEKFFLFLSKLSTKKYWNFLEGYVLEVGCGLGQNIYGHQNAIGIDISPFAVEMCKKRGINAEVLSVEDMNFKEETFNGIFCSHVLEHLENPLEALKKFYKVLKPHGKIVITIPLPCSKSTKADQHLYCWNLMEISNLLERAGFKAVDYKISALRLKSILCYLPFRLAYPFSKLAGMFFRLIRYKTGVNELIIYAFKQTPSYER